MNLITRIVVIGCTGLIMGATTAGTVDWAMAPRVMLAAAVAFVVWIILGRVAAQRRGRVRTGVPADDNTAR